MSADAASTRTSEQRLPSPLNGRLFITTRPVAPEKGVPAIGSTMAAELGPAWADSIVIGATDGPDSSKKILTITHVRIPSEAEQLSSNWEQVQVAVGGKSFPGVVRSVILLASDYQDDSPAIDSALPVIAGGLFDGDGYVLYDRECPKSGIELEPTFRVDRRTYVKTSNLIGQQAYEQRQVVDTSEILVMDGVDALEGLGAGEKALIVSATVNPIGNGKSVKQVVSVPAWDIHTEKNWNDELQTHVTHTEQFVPVSAIATPADDTDYKIVNTDRSLKITKLAPTEALDNFVLSYPVKLRLDLPRVLKKVTVVWNEGEDIGQRFNDFGAEAYGTSWSLSGDNSDTDKSSASLMPEILTEFEDFSTDNLFATAYAFYLPMTPPITQAAILAKLVEITGISVSKWPVFRTKAHTIASLGQSASVTVSTNASNNITWSNTQGTTKVGWQQGHGDDISKNLSNGVAQIAPCIHGPITFEGETSRTKVVSAMATSPIYSSYMQSLIPSHTRSVTVVASVSPASLPATTPASIPITGLYLVDSKVQPYEYNYAKVYAEVFDASDLAEP